MNNDCVVPDSWCLECSQQPTTMESEWSLMEGALPWWGAEKVSHDIFFHVQCFRVCVAVNGRIAEVVKVKIASWWRANRWQIEITPADWNHTIARVPMRHWPEWAELSGGNTGSRPSVFLSTPSELHWWMQISVCNLFAFWPSNLFAFCLLACWPTSLYGYGIAWSIFSKFWKWEFENFEKSHVFRIFVKWILKKVMFSEFST